jgi:hypothetical protein
MRDIMWKQEDFRAAYTTQELRLNTMDHKTFENRYSLISSRHESWWKDRFVKAKEIVKMEQELEVSESSRYILDELLVMDAAGLESLHDKVLSAHDQ